MAPSGIVHALCGSPMQSDCEQRDGSPCYVCASPAIRGMLTDDWAGASFTGQTRVRCPTALYVCESCIFVMSRIAPVPGRPAKEGKKFGGNFRNYSHLWESGAGYANASKGEKPLIREFLRRDHAGEWFAAIADSGQKHVLPWAPMNGPGRGGLVLFDEQAVQVPESLVLVDTMTALLTTGATKDELGSGEYSARAWQLCGAALRAFDAAHGPHRGGAWFGLALWLAQRDEETVQTRLAAEKEEKKQRGKTGRTGKGTTPNADRGGAPRAARRVPAHEHPEPAQALGHPPNAHARSGADVRDAGRMGDADRSQPAGRRDEPRQRTLFD